MHAQKEIKCPNELQYNKGMYTDSADTWLLHSKDEIYIRETAALSKNPFPILVYEWESTKSLFTPIESFFFPF